MISIGGNGDRPMSTLNHPARVMGYTRTQWLFNLLGLLVLLAIGIV
jgi:hypothetical protein